jgi:hypothetical protein
MYMEFLRYIILPIHPPQWNVILSPVGPVIYGCSTPRSRYSRSNRDKVSHGLSDVFYAVQKMRMNESMELSFAVNSINHLG